MLNKFKSKKGFTLMEMLIVVAIIAVLVAIAIPTFTSSLNKAKAGVDLANIRSGYANAQIIAMTESDAAGTYYLKPNGTVTTTADEAYTCKAGSTNAGTFDPIGGRFTPTWMEGQKITYTIDTANDTVGGITAIS